MGLEPVAVGRALKNAVTSLRGEDIVKPLTVAQASDYRDALSKALYGNLFSWLVARINDYLNPRIQASGLEVGVLDIFGFEDFPVNSFEQVKKQRLFFFIHLPALTFQTLAALYQYCK